MDRAFPKIGIITAFEDEIKDQLNIPEAKEVILGVPLGYPDWENPVNRFKSSRENSPNITRWFP